MVSHNATQTATSGDLWRGRIAWRMTVAEILRGHTLGHDYAMSGDHRPVEAS